MSDLPSGRAEDDGGKDSPLYEDIRLLGRLLGDVVREQAGDGVFEIVESARQRSVSIHRTPSEASVERESLGEFLCAQTIANQLHVIRAFSLFSLLSNVAEDVHHARRRRHHLRSGSMPQKGTIAAALDRLSDAGLGPTDVRSLVDNLRVTPVLTAHPTEVRRKTVLDIQNRVSALLVERDDHPMGVREARAWEAALRLQVLLLWQTALLRLSKLRVTDEINESLGYYDRSLFEVIVHLHADLDAELERRFGPPVESPPSASDGRVVLEMGSWIGGDRDGNPFVTAEVLDGATSAQARIAYTYHLASLERLALQLSISSRLASVTPALAALAAVSGDTSAFRQDEPYRQALRGMFERTLASARGDVRGHEFRTLGDGGRSGTVAAYQSPGELISDLRVVEESLGTHGAVALAAEWVAPVRRGIEIFGFHLCGLDLRQM